MITRNYTRIDHLLIQTDLALRTLFGRPRKTERSNPAKGLDECELTDQQRQHVGRLMRVNHTGEVCAQALYQGQALTARQPETRHQLERSALEENDHLAWCEERIAQLGERKSLLNPFWYLNSFAVGALAGVAGDKWSLGFVVETERQVENHLEDHLKQVPQRDERTRAILMQMKVDEIHHALVARNSGGVDLPAPARLAMKLTSQLMTRSVYWV